jgi:hypothetical protein
VVVAVPDKLQHTGVFRVTVAEAVQLCASVTVMSTVPGGRLVKVCDAAKGTVKIILGALPVSITTL